LNDKQKRDLWFGISVIVIMGAYPPWQEVGAVSTPLDYAPIFQPPKVAAGVGVAVDFARLAIEWFLAGLVTAGLVATDQDKFHKPMIEGSKPKSVAAGGQPRTITQTPPPEPEEVKWVTVKFPQPALGDVLVDSPDDDEYWEWIGPAEGEVQLPEGRKVQLDLKKDEKVDLRLLSEIDHKLISSLDFSNSKVKDEDLQYLTNVESLEELDLSDTGITNGALDTLKDLPGLRKLWLDRTKVDERGLEKIKQLQSVRKLSLMGTDITESDALALKVQLPNCQFVLSDGRTV